MDSRIEMRGKTLYLLIIYSTDGDEVIDVLPFQEEYDLKRHFADICSKKLEGLGWEERAKVVSLLEARAHDELFELWPSLNDKTWNYEVQTKVVM